jgi:hypothetical protein
MAENDDQDEDDDIDQAPGEDIGHSLQVFGDESILRRGIGRKDLDDLGLTRLTVTFFLYGHGKLRYKKFKGRILSG